MPRFSPTLHRWFVVYLRRFFARNFSGVRTAATGTTPADSSQPLIVYTNHPSWWDPIHFLLLARFELPRRHIFGPFDARALEKYPLLERLGAFPLDRESRRGTTEFLSTARGLLGQPEASLWLTGEGRFRDPRARPIRLMPGLAHLARRVERAWIVPLAVEYPFWNERRPEALSRFGEPVVLEHEPERSAAEWSELFEHRLLRTMDALSRDAQSRNPDLFRTLVAGRTGVGGVYDMGRRLRALARGRRFEAAHEDRRP